MIPVYVVISPTARTDGNYLAKGYAGPSGRLDVVARSYLAISESSFKFYALLLGPPRAPRILLAPSECRSKVSSERSFMVEASKALRGLDSCFKVIEGGVETLSYILSKETSSVLLLREEGGDVSRHLRELCGDRPAFIAGSHIDPPEDVARYIERSLKPVKVSVGPLSLHTDHVFGYISLLRIGRENCRGLKA